MQFWVGSSSSPINAYPLVAIIGRLFENLLKAAPDAESTDEFDVGPYYGRKNEPPIVWPDGSSSPSPKADASVVSGTVSPNTNNSTVEKPPAFPIASAPLKGMDPRNLFHHLFSDEFVFLWQEKPAASINPSDSRLCKKAKKAAPGSEDEAIIKPIKRCTETSSPQTAWETHQI
ncbi:hypothetical protein AN958_01863 [Leucoagaricus sp. SymC.cos]|nr:hypothetical protein AN958_01863 [Leucoagaricus sp. SymC.cos]